MNARTFLVPLLAAVMIAACDRTAPTDAGDAATLAARPELASQIQSTSSVTPFPSGPVIDGASASISRSANGVNAWLQTSGLTPGHAYTLWVIVFNHPEYCAVPDACTVADVPVDDPDVGIDLINGAGLVVGNSGQATFSGRINVGDLGIRGVGLLDPYAPEIHLAVRDHGPKLPGNAQLSEFGGGCGEYACANVQAAAGFGN